MNRAIRLLICSAAISTMLLAEDSLLSRLPHSTSVTTSTIPPDGDLNPYGVAFVPRDFPFEEALQHGDVLVSNFNDSANLQGTGATIVSIKRGRRSVFFRSPAAVGLSTALGILRAGFVLVGNVPTRDGTFNTISKGSLLVIDRWGRQIRVLESSTLLDGPWNLTVFDEGDRAQVFVSNVLSGTITRLTFRFNQNGFEVTAAKQIGSGYAHRSDPAALVVGPTGLAYDRQTDTLYVASTGDNEIFAIPHAATTDNDDGRGALIIDDPIHLHGPLGLVLTRSGHLILANGDAVNPDPNHPSELEEYTTDGTYLASYTVDMTPGSAFGIALQQRGDTARFAAVDDSTNTVTVWDVK